MYISSMNHSEETKCKISASLKGKPSKLRGRKRSAEAIEKCRISLLKAHADGKFKGAKYRGSKHFTGKSHSEATKKKMRDARLRNQPMHRLDVVEKRSKTLIDNGTFRGDRNNTWKGGITPKNTAIRNSSEYAEWRKSVFLRDDHTCQKCGIRSAKGIKAILNAHHIMPFATHHKLRLSVDNGQTLCRSCHDKEPKGKAVYAVN